MWWNGTAWTQVPSPNPYCATCDSLYGVTATSATSAWAVGTEALGSDSCGDSALERHRLEELPVGPRVGAAVTSP